MSNLSELFSSGAVKSIQSGYVATSALSTGTLEDFRFLDVTISAVNPAKILDVTFIGGLGSGFTGLARSGPSNDAFDVIPKVTSATNLRLSAPSLGGFSGPQLTGRWRVVEAG